MYLNIKTPTLTELQSRIASDINFNLPTQDANLRYTPLNALASANAGAFYEQYSFISNALDQTSVLYATGKNLDNHGAIWKILRKQATAASGTVEAYGNPGTVIPAGTILDYDGVKFTTTITRTIPAPGVIYDLAVAAQLPGASGNAEVTAVLTVASAVAGLESSAVSNGISGGSLAEGDEEYRARILARLAQAPHGGCANDYVEWALEVPGVTRVWVEPSTLGTVYVRFMMDEAHPDAAPTPTDVAAVSAHINDPDRKPISANVVVAAPEIILVDVVFSSIFPDTAAVRANIEAELKDMLRTKGGCGTRIQLSWIYQAINNADGLDYFNIVLPTTDIVPTSGQLPVLGLVSI